MTLEGQVQTLVRAWPIPDRVERGEEIIATTLDLVPDGKSRLRLPWPSTLLSGDCEQGGGRVPQSGVGSITVWADD